MELEVREDYVSVPGGNVYVKTWRPSGETGAPLVLLHDSLGCVGTWRDFPNELASQLNRTVVAYDRLGFGQSDSRHDSISADFVLEEAEIFFPHIIDAVGVSQFATFGHSVGGSMALAIAARIPGCTAVISESAQAFVEARTIEGIETARRAFRNPEAIDRLSRWHEDKSQWVLDSWIDRWTTPEYADWSLARILPSITCPVLAIHGGQDEFGSIAFPEMITEFVSGKSQMAYFPEFGHIPHREDPDRIIRLVHQFLTRQI